MNLVFANETSMSGRIFRGYLNTWNKTRNNGSYNNGRDFLFIHWEAHEGKLDEVRLHVESPKVKDGIELNLLKNRIMIGIMSKLLEIQKTMIIGSISIKGRLFNTDINKSSEVFRVIIKDPYVKKSYEENIKQVHDTIGDIVSKVIENFKDDIKIQFPC